MRILFSLAFVPLAFSYFKQLPAEFRTTPGTWAWISYDQRDVAVLPEPFNRSVLYAPWNSTVSDPGIKAT